MMGTDPECLDDHQLVALADGTMAAAARQAIDGHADRCDSCRALVAAIARLTTPVVQGPEAELAADPVDAVTHDRRRPGANLIAAGTRLGDYVVLEAIGRGGMGEVYSAYAPRLAPAVVGSPGLAVAVKLLPAVDPDALVRFKREFRAVADVTHRNLVQLYELVSIDGRWFFSMELLDGTDFLTHVRGRGRTAADLDAILARLRPVLLDVSAGLVALHAAGHVHRDVKPSNIVIDPTGRAVLLDFGAIAELRGDARERVAIGTPAYMAPEQRRGDAVTPASDWYAVGVMLYEALTGRRPFPSDHRERAPRPPSELVDGIPAGFDRLCLELLAVDPAQRAGAAEIARLAGHPEPAVPRLTRYVALAGREHEAALLHTALVGDRDAGPRAIFVHGPSGIGKTFLVRRVVERFVAQHGGVLLHARCHDREAIPYKALDPLIDAIARFLHTRPAAERAVAVAEVGPELAQMFPVLASLLPAVDDGGGGDDALARRRRAIAGLRSLLRALSDRGPLVLWIDDLQWGDEDSARVMIELLAPPAVVGVRWIGTARGVDGRMGPFVEHVLGAGAWPPEARLEIELAPLAAVDADALARALIERDEPAIVAQIVAEADGSPLFISELAAQARLGRLPARGASLDQAIRRRAGRLAPGAHALLEVVATAGRPLRSVVAAQAASIEHTWTTAVTQLRAERWLQVVREDREELVELVHDRLGLAILGELTAPTVRDLHRRIAVAEVAAGAPPEILTDHWRRAGEPVLAAEAAALAAGRAVDALAFERGAELYRLAITLRGEGSSAELHARLGAALAAGGRGVDAADAYRAASRRATDSESLEYGRLAAEQLLRSGRIDAGLAAMQRVLDALELNALTSPRRALVALALLRVQLFFTRVRPTARRSPPSITDAQRIDSYGAVAIVLGTVDTVPAAALHTRALLLALRRGDPARLARALAAEAAFSATRGAAATRRTARLLATAAEVAAATDQPLVHAVVVASRGMAAFLEGRWSAARALCRQAATALRLHGAGTWERYTAELYALIATYYLGDLAEMQTDISRQLADAEQRGDLYVATSLRSALTNSAWLAAGDPGLARAQVRRADEVWSRRGFHLQHYWTLLASGQIDLYEGDVDGYDRLLARWPALMRSQLPRIQIVRAEALFLRGRLALQTGRQGRDAAACARRLRREPVAYAVAFADLLAAGAAAAAGDRARAATTLAIAAKGFTGCEMAVFALAARRARGVLIGDNGECAAAERALTACGVVEPSCMSRCLVPIPEP